MSWYTVIFLAPSRTAALAAADMVVTTGAISGATLGAGGEAQVCHDWDASGAVIYYVRVTWNDSVSAWHGAAPAAWSQVLHVAPQSSKSASLRTMAASDGVGKQMATLWAHEQLRRSAGQAYPTIPSL